MIQLNGNKIKELRQKAGLSQFNLSLEADLNKELICKIECGKRKMTSLDTAYKLAKYFNVKIEDLIN
jgi:DNA-binding XRE family transcriptional regulator